MESRHRQQSQRQSGRLPWIRGHGGVVDQLSCVLQGAGDSRVGAPLHPVDVLVPADGEEAGEGELAHGPGSSHCGGNGGAVEVAQDRPGSRIDVEVLRLLASIFDRQEHRLGGRAARPVEGVE